MPYKVSDLVRVIVQYNYARVGLIGEVIALDPYPKFANMLVRCWFPEINTIYWMQQKQIEPANGPKQTQSIE